MTPDMLTVALGDRAYDIFFGEDVYPLVQEWICRFYPGRPVYVVTDRNVDSIYGEDIRRCLAGIPHRVHAIEPGEETKNWQTVLGIYAFLAEGKAGRDALILAFGGGVVGDLAGFAAATWLRGVPYVQMPTTLLSQVDSSVGGKTGFNLPEGKNLVGAFHQPQAVFIGHGFLRTLDDRELLAGMGEVIKCALAGDKALWDSLCAFGSRWRSMSGREWHDVIRRAVAFKAAIVAADERESSVRRVLNLGHTVGHALEQAGGYRTLLHGEAVAVGLAWEAVLARRLGAAPQEVEDRVCSLLKEYGFALDVPGIATDAIASAVGADKKRVASDVDLPVVASPGSFTLTRVPLAAIRRELPAVREEIRNRDRGTAVDSAEEKALRARMAEGDVDGAIAALESRVESNPRDLRAMLLLSEAYLSGGKLAAAWETVKEALGQCPAEARAQRLARVIEGKLRGSVREEGAAPPPLEDVILLEEGAFEIRPADLPEEAAEPVRPAPAPAKEGERAAAPTVLTVTMADVCWDQGEREIARRIVDEILRRDPNDPRALEWKKTREERSAENALAFFLGMLAKEYGYDLSGSH